MSGYTDDDLAGLTDEERAALQEDDGSGAGDGGSTGDDGDDSAKSGTSVADEGKANGGDDGKGQQADAGGQGGEEGGGDGGNGAAADDGKGADGGAGSGGADDAGKQPTDRAGDAADAKAPIVPLLVADAPADAEAKFKEISDKKGVLLGQFDDGDITAKEYQTQLDSLNKEERALERAIDKAQTAAEMRQQQEMGEWMKQVTGFTTKEHPEYKTSRARWMALDSFVKEIAAENPNLDGGEILRQAHAKVIEDLGEAQTKQADPGGKKDDAAKKLDDKAGKPLKGSKVEPPATLGKIPATDNADITDGKFTALDRLAETDPMAHEEKLMKMSAAERDEYLASRA
jgi:hypothetical protein